MQGQLDFQDKAGQATTSFTLGDSFYLEASLENRGNATTPPLVIGLLIDGPFFNVTSGEYGVTGRLASKSWMITAQVSPGPNGTLSRGDWYDTSHVLGLTDGSQWRWDAGDYLAHFHWEPENTSDNRLDFIGTTELNFHLAPNPPSTNSPWLIPAILAVAVVAVAASVGLKVYRERQPASKGKGKPKTRKKAPGSHRKKRWRSDVRPPTLY